MWICAPSRADAASCDHHHKQICGLLSEKHTLYGLETSTERRYPSHSYCASFVLKSCALQDGKMQLQRRALR